MILQFTGLSGAGKSSIAQKVKQLLEAKGHETAVIDGDQYRQTICKGLGFSKEDRCENIRRLGAVAASFSSKGCIAIIAAINPYDEVRSELKDQYGAMTVWIDCSLEVLLQRDTKGLYRRALLPDGDPEKVHNLTGVNDAYEPPAQPDLVLQTHTQSLDECAAQVVGLVMRTIAR